MKEPKFELSKKELNLIRFYGGLDHVIFYIKRELEKAEKQILLEKQQIKTQVDSINGEIAAYNKIEPPVTDAETTQEPETELEPAK